MNYGIGNVKAKSSGGGGGIPTITIAQSQAISGGFRLTAEQYDMVKGANIFNMELEGDTNVSSFTRTNYDEYSDEIEFDCIKHDIGGTSLNTIHLRIIPSIIETEKAECYVIIDSFEKAKQLYQYNIQLSKITFNYDSRSLDGRLLFSFTSSEDFTDFSDLVSYLQQGNEIVLSNGLLLNDYMISGLSASVYVNKIKQGTNTNTLYLYAKIISATNWSTTNINNVVNNGTIVFEKQEL